MSGKLRKLSPKKGAITGMIHCLYDRLMPVAELSHHPKNRNKHPDDQIDRLAGILKYQGWRYPIKVSKRSGFITSGHGRLLAAIKNGWSEVPVNYQDYDSEEQEYADVQADNAIASWAELDLSGINIDVPDLGPDFDINMLGIKDFVLEPADKLDPQCDEDAIPEKVEPKTKLGDIYQLGRHRLMCGDSTFIDAVEKLMDGQRADMVFTDPPYNQSKPGGGMADKRPGWKKNQDNGLSDFEPAEFLNVLSILQTPSIYIFCNKNLLKQYFQWIEDQSRSWNLLVMRKKNPIPMKNNTFLADVEWLVFTRGDNATFNNDLEYDFYRRVFDTEVKESEYGHPTEKRVHICERFILISSKHKDKVLDLFGGSGTTMIACEKTNRKCFMMELDPHYCDVIVARWEKYTGGKAKLLTENTEETANAR
jgi:DNA modification methylase